MLSLEDSCGNKENVQGLFSVKLHYNGDSTQTVKHLLNKISSGVSLEVTEE